MTRFYTLPEKFLAQVREGKPWLEKDLIQSWQSLEPGSLLRDRGGQPVMILSPGILNHNDGPDFKNAVIFREGKIYRGSVECHRSGKDWFIHGHAHDSAYTHVILHVLGTSTSADANLKGPVVYLRPAEIKRNPCSLGSENRIGDPQAVLKMLAKKRWQEKMGEFIHQNYSIDRNNLMLKSYRMLGVGGNEDQFTDLGRKVLKIQDYLNFRMEDLEVLASNINWKRCGIRPHHHPQNRFSVALILNRFIIDLIEVPFSGSELFEANFQEYFDLCCGVGLSSELKGNVFYPWLGAKALSAGNMSLYKNWYSAWENLKLPYSYGKFLRRFRTTLSRKTLMDFSCLQGLLILDSVFCSCRHCSVCPLKNLHGHLG